MIRPLGLGGDDLAVLKQIDPVDRKASCRLQK